MTIVTVLTAGRHTVGPAFRSGVSHSTPSVSLPLLARSYVKYGDRGRAELRTVISVLQETEALVHLLLSILDAWGRPVRVGQASQVHQVDVSRAP
jgi:hypothetical protein